jgi:hypothetical protein
MNWLFSIYVIFLVAIIVPLRLAPVHGAASGRDPGARRRSQSSSGLVSPFSVVVLRSCLSRARGCPIGHAMIAGSLLYLGWRDSTWDGGRAAAERHVLELSCCSRYRSSSSAAEFMSSGSIMDRLLRFCNALVGRFRGGLAQVNVVQSIIFASMSGSALADAASSGKLMQTLMTRDGKYPPGLCRRADRGVLGDRADHPALDPLVLYALVSDTSVGYLFSAASSRAAPGRVQMALIAATARRRNFPVEARVPLRELPRVTWEAFPALMMPVILLGLLYSGVTTPRRRRGGGGVRAAGLGRPLSQHRLARRLQLAPHERAHHDLDRDADRGRAGLQLRDHGREHPEGPSARR